MLAVAVLLLAAAPVRVLGWTGSLIFENDVLWVDDSDRHYTNGFQFCLAAPAGRSFPVLERPARWLTRAGPEAEFRTRFALGQNLYTPEDIESTDLVADDRPYAGWLHADVAVAAREGRNWTEATLSIGMVGPAAQGEELQRWFHGIIGSPIPEGWDHQLANEPALLLGVQRSWGEVRPPRPLPVLGGLGVDWDFVPHGDVAVGNVFTHVALGGVLRLGNSLAGNLGPPRIRPTAAGGDLGGRGGTVAWSVFGGLTGRYVLRNIFLDGNTFADSHSVDKIPVVGDAWFGIAAAHRGLRVAFVHTMRSPEFRTQRRPDHFGSVSVAFTP